MGTLYVVGVPEGNPDDITLRARRVLDRVALIVAVDVDQARHLLARYQIATSLVDAVHADVSLEALRAGDVALLHTAWSPGPTSFTCALIRAAIEHGFPVVPIPGPSPVVTALVISGLPADSFVYLGELPLQPPARHELLALVVDEPRTLVVMEWPDRLPDTLADLYDALGHRTVVVVAASQQEMGVVWRGTVGEAPAHLLDCPSQGPCVLVLSGARQETIRWEEDRLLAEVRACLARGLGAKEISQQLTKSGWRRREIYRLATQVASFSPGENL
jgi:16S rRNA (cytidine1402-2'-O)-methyltransferase